VSRVDEMSFPFISSKTRAIHYTSLEFSLFSVHDLFSTVRSTVEETGKEACSRNNICLGSLV
jgi:hypothetical protein